jgi:cytochrome P450 family 144
MTVVHDPTQFFGAEALRDPYPLYDRMRAEAPVHRIGTSVFYAVCGWDAVLEAVERVDDFSSNLTATMVYHDDGTVTPFAMAPPGGPAHALATADDPVHAMHRKILLPHLSAKRVRIIEEFAAQAADRLWNENLRDGEIEWMSAVANRLPMMVVARLLGLPEDDVDKLIRLGYATTTLLDGIVTPAQLEAAGVAAFELSAYVLEHFEKASTTAEHGLIGDLAARYASGELEQLPALGMMLTLFSAAANRPPRCWAAPRGFSRIARRRNGRSGKTQNCWALSSKRCCASNRRFVATTGTCGATRPWPGCRCPPIRTSC